MTVRGSNFPPAKATKTVFFSPLRSTAESGTSSADGATSGCQFHRGKHARLEEIARIVKLHPHPRRARLLVHGRINVGDAPAELAVRQVGEAHRRLLAELDEGQVLLVNLRLHPDDAQVGQPVELHAGIDHLALDDHLLDHEAVARAR